MAAGATVTAVGIAGTAGGAVLAPVGGVGIPVAATPRPLPLPG
jgi:hypothetical protein